MKRRRAANRGNPAIRNVESQDFYDSQTEVGCAALRRLIIPAHGPVQVIFTSHIFNL